MRKPQNTYKSPSKLLIYSIYAILFLLAINSAILFQSPHIIGAKEISTDFNAFYIAGQMAGRGDANLAYQAKHMLDELHKQTSNLSFMPWTYPPPYTLAMMYISKIPIGVSYFIFITISFVFYIAVLKKISGEYLSAVLVSIFPGLMLLARTGQNGFVTGGLIGLFLILYLKRKNSAGIPLGLMIIKPHLAVGISILSLLGRRWHAMMIATIVIIVACTITTLVYGHHIWISFIESVRESSFFLAAGYYPLERMTSAYALVRSSGATPDIAMIAQAVSAILAIIAVTYAWLKKIKPSHLAAVTCFATVFISPYSYDYDLMVVGVGLAFIIPEIIHKSSNIERFIMLIMMWASTGIGIATQITGPEVKVIKPNFETESPQSLAFIFIIFTIVFILFILRRKDINYTSDFDQKV